MKPQNVLVQPEISAALAKYQEALWAGCPGEIQRLILFGSYARGEATAESDVDVLVVVNWETERLPGGFYAAPFSDPRWKAIIDAAHHVLFS
jgi:hypothetical protein